MVLIAISLGLLFVGTVVGLVAGLNSPAVHQVDSAWLIQALKRRRR
jgi:hypothetical protein